MLEVSLFGAPEMVDKPPSGRRDRAVGESSLGANGAREEVSWGSEAVGLAGGESCFGLLR